MVSNSNIIKIARSYKSYVEKNKKTPATITLNNVKYTYKQCASLFANFVIYPTKDFSVGTIKGAKDPDGDIISENILESDYTNMAKRLRAYITENKQLPNYLKTTKSKKKVKPSLYIYAFARIVVFYGDKKKMPNYVTINSSSFSTSTTTKKSKYGHATKQGCDNMGQNTGYYCGCHSLQEVFRNLTGKVVPQSTIARWAGTTTSGTGHAGLESAVAMFNKTYGYNLTVQWKNLSDVGWSGVKKILESSDQDIVFHNLYRNTWGHYEVANSISGSTVQVQNSLGSEGCGSCYCGYVEARSTGTFQTYMSGISQKSLMIIKRG